jgi:uncharacterized delta-60 repeat protein
MKKILMLLLGICGVFVLGVTAWAWQTTINGTANSSDQARAVKVDGMGSVVVAGRMRSTDTDDDFTVVKLDGVSGGELWRAVINGSLPNSSDVAFAVAVDAAGDVVAAGFTQNTGTDPADFTVVKLSGADGTELWRQVINGSANFFDQAFAVTVDGAGNVIAAGSIQNTGIFDDFTVVKLSGADGTELWRQVINGTGNVTDRVLAVAVDAAGNVVAAGFTQNAGTGQDFTVVKFDGESGAELWRQEINGTAANSLDQARAITVDGMGNVMAAGRTRNAGTTDDLTVVKFDGESGAELWRQVISGSADVSTDDALAVAVDAAGNVVAAGHTENAGTDDDFTVVKFDGESGAELWRQEINGTANEFDQARAITVDAEGNVVAAGRTENAGTGGDFTVVKLRGEDGGDF